MFGATPTSSGSTRISNRPWPLLCSAQPGLTVSVNVASHSPLPLFLMRIITQKGAAAHRPCLFSPAKSETMEKKEEAGPMKRAGGGRRATAVPFCNVGGGGGRFLSVFVLFWWQTTCRPSSDADWEVWTSSSTRSALRGGRRQYSYMQRHTKGTLLTLMTRKGQ